MQIEAPATSFAELKEKYQGSDAIAASISRRRHLLSVEEEDLVTFILSGAQMACDLLSNNGISMQDIRMLRPMMWLNDVVIDIYGNLIQVRSRKRETANLLDVHYFGTFFWSTLKKLGYHNGRLSAWTKKVSVVI